MITATANPVQQSERISILDSLRGIAILGILLMNIPGFALPEEMIFNPLLDSSPGNIDYSAWFYVEWILEGSQRALFSMLFGAGTILFVSRLEKRSPGLAPADYYFRRQLWLLVFGLFNGFILLWFWDILFSYACCGMIIFTFRKMSPKHLIIAAMVCLVFQATRDNIGLIRGKNMIESGLAVEKLDTTINKLTDKQKAQLTEMSEFRSRSTLESQLKKSNESKAQMLGSYQELYRYQSNRTYRTETGIGYFGIWDLLLFMFLGMAFYKSGILTGNVSSKIYWPMFIAGLGIGLILSWFRLKTFIDTSFNEFEFVKNTYAAFYQLSRFFRSIGIFGMIMLMYKSGWFNWIFSLLKPVGQMAFTNYLMQSLVCGIFFYGIGFGYFGQLRRFEIYYVVAAVWIIQIIWSHIWLRYFRLGPLEWAWRSLTYWKIQPIKKENNAGLGSPLVPTI